MKGVIACFILCGCMGWCGDGHAADLSAVSASLGESGKLAREVKSQSSISRTQYSARMLGTLPQQSSTWLRVIGAEGKPQVRAVPASLSPLDVGVSALATKISRTALFDEGAMPAVNVLRAPPLSREKLFLARKLRPQSSLHLACLNTLQNAKSLHLSARISRERDAHFGESVLSSEDARLDKEMLLSKHKARSED